MTRDGKGGMDNRRQVFRRHGDGCVVHDFQNDIDDVAAIEVVPSILQVMQATTGMGFVAVARVTEERWIACAVLDTIDFGLTPGGELSVRSTICDEIRDNRQLVAIDHVSESATWANHHTPLQYGFQSYISVPIILGDGSFFGTLCAIDPNPAQVDNPRVISTAKLVRRPHRPPSSMRAGSSSRPSGASSAELETSHLRDQFIAILGHDIKNPVASIDAVHKAAAQVGDRSAGRDDPGPDGAERSRGFPTSSRT
jgi:signal transduction histidine kinase